MMFSKIGGLDLPSAWPAERWAPPLQSASGQADTTPSTVNTIQGENGSKQCWGFCFWASWMRIHLSELWIRILPFYHKDVETGTTILTFFDKMEPPRPLIVAKLNSKKHLKYTFLAFLSRFVRVWLKD